MTLPPPSAKRDLSPAVLAAYGVGEIGVTVSMTLFGLFILFFYTTVMGLPATLAGIGASAGLLWDAVVDPWIGHRSDQHRGRLGRRHGFMLAGASLMGLSFWLLLAPPPGLGRATLFAWLVGTTLLFRFTAALFRIPYLGLGAELSQDQDQRTLIAGVRSLFGLVGTLGAATLSFILFFPDRAGGGDPRLGYDGYPRLGLAFGLVMTAAGLIATAGTLGHRRSDAAGAPDRGPFLRALASAWANRAFRRVWLAFTLFAFGVVMNAAVAIHFFSAYAGIGDSRAISSLQLSLYLGALAGVVPWVWMARRREKRSLCLVAVSALAALMALAAVLFGEGHLFGMGNRRLLFVGSLLAGFFASALWVLPPSMLADVADDDEVRRGERREGLFFGLLNLGEKIAAGTALLCTGVLLDLFVGLVPGSAPTGPSLSRIGVVYGVVPAVVLLGSAASLSGYRLDRRAVTEIQARLGRKDTTVVAA